MDDEAAISYKLLLPGTAVLSSDGAHLRTVDQVLDNIKVNIFDGIVVATPSGKRFVDAPEVGRITKRAVTLTIDAAAAAKLPAPEPGAGEYRANLNRGGLSRIFGRGWRKK